MPPSSSRTTLYIYMRAPGKSWASAPAGRCHGRSARGSGSGAHHWGGAPRRESRSESSPRRFVTEGLGRRGGGRRCKRAARRASFLCLPPPAWNKGQAGRPTNAARRTAAKMSDGRNRALPGTSPGSGGLREGSYQRGPPGSGGCRRRCQ